MDEQVLAGQSVFARMKERRPLAETSAMKAAASDFDSVVREFARFVFKVTYSVLRNVEDAEDAVQETFLRVHRSGELPNVREVKPWLARIAWRVALDRINRRPETSLEPLMEMGFEARSREISAEQGMLEQERAAMLHKLMAALPEDLRQTLILSTVEDMTSGQIGEILGIPETSVRTRLFRARQILKEKLTALTGDRHGS
jgi:RNA polymerase sigma-70 factor, ECF subfamily